MRFYIVGFLLIFIGCCNRSVGVVLFSLSFTPYTLNCKSHGATADTTTAATTTPPAATATNYYYKYWTRLHHLLAPQAGPGRSAPQISKPQARWSSSHTSVEFPGSLHLGG